jgi:hypothetical protein
MQGQGMLALMLMEGMSYEEYREVQRRADKALDNNNNNNNNNSNNNNNKSKGESCGA